MTIESASKGATRPPWTPWGMASKEVKMIHEKAKIDGSSHYRTKVRFWTVIEMFKMTIKRKG